MATAILKRFPHLVTESIGYADAVDLWHGRIKTHCKKNRFRNKGDVPYWRGGVQIQKVN